MAGNTGSSSGWKLDFSSVEGLKPSTKSDPPGYDSALARDWVGSASVWSSLQPHGVLSSAASCGLEFSQAHPPAGLRLVGHAA
jgi:hypothetical protein